MKILIVGSGYAGTVLSYFLASNGAEVTITDKNEYNTSTKVSAGIILPVTGRRLAKTYLADTVIPFAFQTYKEIESKSGVRFFQEKKVLQLFTNTANQNEWFARTADDDLAGYTGDFFTAEQLPRFINNQVGGIILLKSGFVDPLQLLTAFKKLHTDQITRLTGALDYSDLQVYDTEVIWNKWHYDYVIFCEGYETISNPWFSHLPFKPAKGEIIDFSSSELTDEFIINGSVFILPMGNGKFRAGSTYEWNDLVPVPTEKGKKELLASLDKMINCKYELSDHKAGIRPAIKNRRPVLGFHPVQNRIGIFNGLGTKGVMLAPYFAFLLSEHIFKHDIPIPAEFGVQRFNYLLSGH